MKILISSAATSYTIWGKSLHLHVSFSWFTKQAEKSLVRKAARLDSSCPRAAGGPLLYLHASVKYSPVSWTGSLTLISCHLCGNSGDSSQKAVTFALNS